jgi:hypothetical protein
MNTYLLLAILGAAFFSVCLALLIIKFGIPTSLSESYYNLGGKDGKGFFFYLMLAITVFLMLAPMVEAAKFWGFLCGAALLFVGAAPAFKKDGSGSLDPIIHIVSTIICAASAMAVLIKINLWWMAIITLAIAVGLAFWTKTVKKCYVFWLEMAAFYGLFAGVITHFALV